MKEILLGVYIGSGIVGLAITVFALIVLLYFLAKSNLFFAFVEEGTAKAILKYGEFHRAVMTYEGYGLDTDWTVRNKKNEVDENGNIIYYKDVKDSQGNIIHHQGDLVKDETGTTLKLRPEPWFRLGGLLYVGIPLIHSVYKHNFRWTSFEQREEKGKLVQKTISHEEVIDYILVQDDIYYTFVREAEARGMVPLDIDALLTIRVLNPYKALFRVQGWLETTLNQFKPVLVGYTGQKSFEELVETQKQVGDTIHELLKISQIDENLEKDYGIHLKKIGIVNIDPAGDRGKKYVEAASKEWEAQKEAQRLDNIYKKIQEYGDTGLFLRAIEGLEKASEGPSNLVVFPLGSVKSMIKGWCGGNRQEKATEKGGT